MIDQYAALFRLDAAPPPSAPLLTRLRALLTTSYAPFDNRLLYFAAATACLLLLVSAAAYATLGNRLQMPRSFRHMRANIWCALLLLLAVYTLGIRQVCFVCLLFVRFRSDNKNI